MNPANYLKIKNKIPSNVNILAVSKGFKSQEIKTIQNIGQNDFGESKVQEAFEKQLTLKDLKQINWHFIGRVQSNKIRKIVPSIISITSSSEIIFGNPPLNPPSLNASIIKAIIAGPDEVKAKNISR